MRVVHVRRAVLALALALSAARAQQPQQATVCQIKSDPAAYNHKLVQVTAFASHGFEDFTLFDPHCKSYPEIWLEYGGTTASGTVYCCVVPADRKRPKPIAIEGLTIPLADDKPFRDFDRLIQRPPDSIAHATVVGRFFAGDPSKTARAGGGFGHMGCCSLLVIQQVLAVDPRDRSDLDYRSVPDHSLFSRSGCEYRILTKDSGALATQQQAEAGLRDWSFTDARRVAADVLAGLVKVDPGAAINLKETALRRNSGKHSNIADSVR